MNYKPIIIIPGDPDSIFFEIFFKTLKKKQIKSPIILISSLNLVRKSINKYCAKVKLCEIKVGELNKQKFKKKIIYIINIDYKLNKNSKKYLNKCFNEAFKILKSGFTNKLLNGPITKKYFLNKKFLGITEFIAHSFNIKKNAMLIYNKKLSVCPITTHLPISMVAKNIDKKIIKEKVILINKFYKEKFKIKPRIGILGLNPHCESIKKVNEDDVILKPVIKSLKKLNNNISGPYSADTCFIKQNRFKFDVIIGMYHDQVLTPLKTLFEYDAINITLGLPFIRISPDHGPNKKMFGKNISNPLSLIRAIEFLDKN